MIKGIADNGSRILASKGAKATCPQCKGGLVPKCGSIKVHHWAHKEAKGCLYSYGMTQWHYKWLNKYNGLSSDGWEIEYSFDSVYFDAFNPNEEKAIEFQRTIDIESISHKIEICKNAGITLFWLFNSKIFRNFIYTNNYEGNERHILYSRRRCNLKISNLLEKYMSHKSLEFLIDFSEGESLTKYFTDEFGSYGVCSHGPSFDEHKHPMKQGLYIIKEMPLLQNYCYYNRCVLQLTYHEMKY